MWKGGIGASDRVASKIGNYRCFKVRRGLMSFLGDEIHYERLGVSRRLGDKMITSCLEASGREPYSWDCTAT